MNSDHRPSFALRSVFKVFIGVLVVVQLFPLLVIILTGLRSPASVLREGIFSLSDFGLANFKILFEQHAMVKSLLSSLVIGVSSAFLGVVIAAALAFACTHLHFRYSKQVILMFVCFRLVPPAALVIPLFVLMSHANLNDTHTGLILAHTGINLPFALWLMLPFFRSVPPEMIQAAQVDGLSSLDTFWRIVLPIVAPGLMVAGIFCFLLSWNDFLLALVLAGSQVQTAPLLVNGFMTGFGPEWGSMAAASLVLLTPVFILSFLLQKHIVSGLSAGSVKS